MSDKPFAGQTTYLRKDYQVIVVDPNIERNDGYVGYVSWEHVRWAPPGAFTDIWGNDQWRGL